jgi:hypothetical protein
MFPKGSKLMGFGPFVAFFGTSSGCAAEIAKKG